jgi:hypothetical protein
MQDNTPINFYIKHFFINCQIKKLQPIFDTFVPPCIHGVPELAYQPLTVYFNICSKRDFATINIQTLVVFKLKPF